MQNQKRFFDDEEMLKLMRDRFLTGLVIKESPYKHRLQEALSSLHLNPYFTFPALALMEPVLDFAEENEKRMYMERLRDDVQRGETNGSAIFMDGDGRLCVLFSWVAKEGMEALGRRLSQQYAVAVNIGVGKPCGQLADIHHSYRQAQLALKDNFYKGAGEIVYYSELANYHSISIYPAEAEQDLFERLKYAGIPEQITAAVDAYFAAILQHGPVAPKSIYELTIRLLIGLEKRLAAERENVSACNRCDMLTVMEKKSIQEVKAFVAGHLTALKEGMLQSDRECTRSIIKKTIQYMEQECQHATLYSVAQKVYMTPTYLSSLFKTNTGKTFIDQLTEIRINKAKEMLKSTHLKNYEVAEKVGYKDSRYFSQIFKKKVGLSPSEYRESTGV